MAPVVTCPAGVRGWGGWLGRAAARSAIRSIVAASSAGCGAWPPPTGRAAVRMAVTAAAAWARSSSSAAAARRPSPTARKEAFAAANRILICDACTTIWRRAGVSPGRSRSSICGQVISPVRLLSAGVTWMRRPAGSAVTVSRAPRSGSPAARSPEYGASWRQADSRGWPLSIAVNRSPITKAGRRLMPRKMSSSVSGTEVLAGCGRAAGSGARPGRAPALAAARAGTSCWGGGPAAR